MSKGRNNVVTEWLSVIFSFLFGWVGGLAGAILFAKVLDCYLFLALMSYLWIRLFFECLFNVIPHAFEKSDIKWIEKYKHSIKILLLLLMGLTIIGSIWSFICCVFFAFICVFYIPFVICYELQGYPQKEDEEARELYEKLVLEGKVTTSEEQYEAIKMKDKKRRLREASKEISAKKDEKKKNEKDE